MGPGIIGVLVLIFLIPREIWIALGIGVIVALAIYFYIQWKSHKPSVVRPPEADPKHEPTLAELMRSPPAGSLPKLPPSANRQVLVTAHQTPEKASAPQASTGNVREVMQHIASKQAQQHTRSSSKPPPLPVDAQPEPTRSDRVILLSSTQTMPAGTASGLRASSVIQGSSGNLREAKRALASRQAFSPSTPLPAPPEVNATWGEDRTSDSISEGEDTPRIVVPSPSRPRTTTSLPSSSTGRRPGNLQEAKQHLVGLVGQLPAAMPPVLPSLFAPVAPTAVPIVASAPSAPVASPDVQARSADQFHSAIVSNAFTARQFAVPKPPEGAGQARWIAPGDSIEINGISIPGGMIYVGSRLSTPNATIEPSLINAGLSIASHGDHREIGSSYWHSYTDLSANERRAYLNWLAGGRSATDCASGYVLIFLFGIERRVLVDRVKDPLSKQDWLAIKSELRRIGALYGENDGHIRACATGLLDWMELDAIEEKLYAKPIPFFPKSYELPIYIRLALGQCSQDRVPIPAQLALTWVRLNPEKSLRTPAMRCAEEFDRLFVHRYHDTLRAGLVLTRNRTKLKFAHRPASPALNGFGATTRTFGDIPDVTALTAPIRTLMEIAHQCTNDLAAFSRLAGKDPNAASTTEGLLLLPSNIWPPQAQANLIRLVSKVKEGPTTLSLVEICSALGKAGAPLSKDRIRDLAKMLESQHIGIEPNVLEGARLPTDTDPVVLFEMLPEQSHHADSDAFQTALLTLQLASTMAQADGQFSDAEVAHLTREIESWSHLSPGSCKRLHAHLQLLAAAPITLASLKKKLDPLGQSAKEAVAASMATLAQVDGLVSPEEMRFLEKVYKALGVDAKRVFTDVHAVSAGRSTVKSEPSRQFRLDPKRIAELQHDTAKVSALLAGIFIEEAPELAADPLLVETKLPEPTMNPGLLGQDEAHSALLRLMLSRPSWSRAELEDSAADLELMLDGALEQINEASFDTYDFPFSEGNDPVEINPGFLMKIEQ